MPVPNNNFFSTILLASLFVGAQIKLSAAESELGNNSEGHINIALRIAATDLNLLASVDTNALDETRQFVFPVCFMYIDSQYVSVNVADLDAGSLKITGVNGEEIPYQVSIGKSAGEAKVRASNSSACLADSELEVSVRLLPMESAQEMSAVNGTINFLIKSE